MINTEEMNNYLRLLVPEQEGLLKELEIEAEKKHIPIVEPEVAQLLRTLINIHRSKRILEIGTAIGYSTICMGEQIASRGGRIVTIEQNEELYRQAENNIKRAGLEKMAALHLGDARDVLPQLPTDDLFDFIFCDAAKGQYLEFYDLFFPLLKPGGLLVSDNVLFRGLIVPGSTFPRRKKTLITRLRTYLKMLSNHPQFVTTVLPIGDGVSISFRKEVE